MDTQTRRERQAEVRTKLVEVLQDMKRISERSMEDVYNVLRNAGVQGDDKDIQLGLKKLHADKVIQVSHSSCDDRSSLGQRRHTVYYLGK
jgi:hypothetical protein